MSSSKVRRVRPLDLPVPVTGAGGVPLVTEAAAPQQPRPEAAAPFGLYLIESGFERSGPSPTAYAEVGWFPGPGTPVSTTWELQWSTASDFSAAPRLKATTNPGEATGLIPGTTYLRARAVVAGRPGAWSAALAVTVAPLSDAPPAAPTGLTWDWSPITGDLTVRWTAPAGEQVRGVQLRILTGAGGSVLRTVPLITNDVFVWTLAMQRADRGVPSAALPGTAHLIANAISWAGNLSSDVTATATLAAPANVTGATATWDGATGACTWRWTSVAGVATYRLTIDGVARTVGDVAYSYPLAQNRVEHSGTADPALTWSLVAVDALGQVSATPASGTATLAAPATPAGAAHSWATNTDVASADWLLTWTQAAGVAGYRLTIDGITRDVGLTGRYPYPFAQNAQEHAGTADPALTWSLVAVDALGQVSAAPASGTATNAAPPATTLTAFGGFSQAAISISPSVAADLLDYRVRVYRDSVLVRTRFVTDPASVIPFEDGNGSYSFDVAPRDRFGQLATASAQTTAVSGTDLAAFVASLRAEARYSDSNGTAEATLAAAMKDGTLASGGVSYASNAGWARWVQFSRELTDRYRVITLSMSPTSGTTTWYVRTSPDGSTWSYYSGPVVGGRTLTAVASASAAQTAAVSAATLGGPTTSRVELPAIVEARFIEVWLRNTAASTRVDEYYPRRIVQADDVETETLTSVHIGAASILGDRIVGTTLAAIKAELGVVTLGTNGGLWQGAGTFAAPTTGLRIWNDAGVGRLATYNGGTVQVQLDSQGRLTWAGGAGRADSTGVAVDPGDGVAYVNLNGYRFSGVLSRNGVFGREDGALVASELVLEDTSSASTRTLIAGVSVTGSETTIARMFVGAAAPYTSLELRRVGLGATQGDATLSRAHLSIPNGGLNLGAATGAAAGQIRATASTAATNTRVTGLILDHQTSATPAAGLGVELEFRAESTTTTSQTIGLLSARWAEATHASRRGEIAFLISDATTFRVPLFIGSNGAEATIGVLGANPVSRQTVTGSRGGNAALASLLSALATFGWILNSTTA